MTIPVTSRTGKWWTLTVVSVSTFMLMLDLSVVAIALPSVHNSLHASFGAMQWVFDAYALTLAAFLVTAGSLADRRGRKRVFLAGLFIFTLASLGCGAAGNIAMLNVSRGVQGVGAAIMFAVGPALLGHEFHGKERATAFGVFGIATGVAAATGPLIGGALTGGPGWRWIFLLNVPVGVVIFVAAMARLRESRLADAAAPDYFGMIAFTLSLGALALAIIRGNTDGWFSATNVGLYLLAGLSLAVFAVIARARRERAMFDPAMFRSSTFIGLSAVTFLANAAGFPSIFIETTYLQRVLHSTAWQAGLRFLPLTITMFVFGGVAGSLAGKVPFRLLMATAMTALTGALLLTQLSNADKSWTALIPSLIAAGVAIGTFMPVRAALAIGIAEPARAGVASGINETFQQVGMALGIAAVGAYFQNRVTSAFLHSGAAAAPGAHSQQAAAALSAGTPAPGATAQVVQAGRVAFTTGFHDAMLLCLVGAASAAVIALVSLRERDLHSTALTGIPPELSADIEPLTSDDIRRPAA